MKSPKRTSSSTTASKKSAAETTSAAGATDAIALLKQDHRDVEALFKEFKTADQDEKQELVERICNELIIHTVLEEEIFYKECRERGVDTDDLDKAQVEHDSATVLIEDLLREEPDTEYYDAKVTVLSDYIKHHVSEEEKPGEGIFAKAARHGLDMSALGKRLQARKQQLMQKAEANELNPPSPRALNIQSTTDDEENRTMARYSSDRDRDERRRYMSDDDDDRRYSRSRYSSRYEDDDDRDRGRGRSGWSGDPEGHSEAARSRRGSSRYEDEDDEYRGRRGRGHGGWYGDPEGHSEAARERWEDDDRRGRDYRSRSSSRYEDEDDYRGGRGRGHGGWYGDPEGHAEAARERWGEDERGGRSARSRSSSRYDEDYDERGRGHGGWYGDPEGHSRASRRGWRDRD